MKSIEEQINDKCIYFDGAQNEYCKMLVKLNDVRDKSVRPYKLPCVRNYSFGGLNNCDKRKWPDEKHVKESVEEINEICQKNLVAFAKVKIHIKNSGQDIGSIKCPSCGGVLRYNVSTFNRHIWAKCFGCDISFNE